MVRVSRLVTTIFCIFVVTDMLNAIRISNSDNAESIKIVERSRVPGIYCYGSGDNTSTITWTLLDDDGSIKSLAKCQGLNKCSAYYNSSFLEVYWSDVTYSYIRFYNFRQTFSGSGLLVCTETNSTSNSSASCPLKMTRIGIRFCEEGMTFVEDSSQRVYCDYSPYPSSTVSFAMKTYSGQTLNLGYCTNHYMCDETFKPNVTLSNHFDSSVVYFSNSFINRDMAQLVFTYSISGFTEMDNCTLDVYNPAIMENCRVEINHHNWSLMLSCDVTNVFSTREQYDFRVYELFDVLKRNNYIPADSFTSDKNLSYRQGLRSYTNYKNNRQYFTGRLVYSWPMSPLPGSYSGFKIHMYPGDHTREISKKFNITLPAAPSHNCTAVDYVSTSIQRTCVCTTEFIGSPAGRLTWIIGDSLLAAGDYGVNQLSFPFDNLTHGESVLKAVCRLDWVKPFDATCQSNIHVAFQAYSSRDEFKAVAIVGWTLLVVVVILVVILVIVMVRQGRLVLSPNRNPTYDSVRRRTNKEEARNYTGLKFSAKASSSNVRGQEQGVSDPSPVYQNMALPGDDIGAHM